MTAWWQKLPSLTRIKGLARFLHVFTHWDTIDAELKRRDERPQAVEEEMRRLKKLQEERHRTERAKDEERHEAEEEAFAELTERAITEWSKGTDRNLAMLDQVVKRFEELRREKDHVENLFIASVEALAVMLFIEDDPGVRDAMLDSMPPAITEAVRIEFARLREVNKIELPPPPPKPTT